MLTDNGIEVRTAPWRLSFGSTLFSILVIVGILLKPLLVRLLNLFGVFFSVLLFGFLDSGRSRCSVLPKSFISACSAHFSWLLSVSGFLVYQVIACVLVTIFASFYSAPCSPSDVFGKFNSFKVVRIAASSISAKMVNDHSVWNWTYKSHVGRPVNKHYIRPSLAESCRLVPIDGGFLRPVPAPSNGVNYDSAKYVLLGEFAMLHDANIVKGTA